MRTWLVRQRHKLRRQLPTAQELAQQRWLRPVAHRIGDPRLWHMNPESVARGTAIGVFWAFAVPFAQIVFAAAHCVWWRGNIPVAAAITFITNPFTVGFWLWLAYKLGSLFVASSTVVVDLTHSGWLDKLQAMGWPTFIGMALFACLGAPLGYLLVRAGAWLWFHWRVARRQRRRRAAARNPAPPGASNPP
jgi:uncharacterized protein (DUF2062 family)